MRVLAIDTALEACSAAVLDTERAAVVVHESLPMLRGHAEALIPLIARMLERADLLGHTEPEHYLWPACQWGRYEATNPMQKWDTAWRALRDAAGLQRFLDKPRAYFEWSMRSLDGQSMTPLEIKALLAKNA